MFVICSHPLIFHTRLRSELYGLSRFGTKRIDTRAIESFYKECWWGRWNRKLLKMKSDCLFKVCSVLNVSSDLKSFMLVSEAASFWTHGMNWTDSSTEEMAALRTELHQHFCSFQVTPVCPRSWAVDAGANWMIQRVWMCAHVNSTWLLKSVV